MLPVAIWIFVQPMRRRNAPSLILVQSLSSRPSRKIGWISNSFQSRPLSHSERLHHHGQYLFAISANSCSVIARRLALLRAV